LQHCAAAHPFDCQIRKHLVPRRRGAAPELRRTGQPGAHCAELEPGGVLVLSYLIAGEARGIGELRPLPGSWPRAAEATISLERTVQGQGIGSALRRRLTLVARNAGFSACTCSA
jgi:GNAT superfamily N-acetyltransferase